MNPSQTMLLLTHTPTLDRAEGYDGWLREAVNPFVAGIPEVVLYSNWRVREAKLGSVPYSHFDCIFVESLDAGNRVWSSDAFQGLQQEWTTNSGGVGDDQADSARLRACLCREVAPPRDSRRSRYVLFEPHNPRPDATQRGFEDWLRDVDSPFINSLPEVVNYSGWRVIEALLGVVNFTKFDLIYLPSADGFERLYGSPRMLKHERRWVALWGAQPGQDLEENFAAVVAECIASSRPL